MPKIMPQNNIDSSLLPELLSFFKKTLKGVIAFFEQQLKDIKISDELTLLNFLKPFGRFLGQFLLLFKFFHLFQQAVMLGNRLGKGCDFIYVSVDHPQAGHFRNGSIKNLPIKIPGNQAYILVGKQLFFVDKHEKWCAKWHIVDNLKRQQFFEKTQAWLIKQARNHKEKENKSQEELDREIKRIPLSRKRLAAIQQLTNHKRPGEIVKGVYKPIFGVIEGTSLFLNTVNSFIKLSLFIASIGVFNGIILQTVSQFITLTFFNISFLFIGINIVRTFSKYLNEKDWEKREMFRNRLFRQVIELLLPLSLIALAVLVWLGVTTPIFSAFLTVGFLGLPVCQSIFRGMDNLAAFQKVNTQKTTKVLKKFIKLAASAVSLITSGYVFAKALSGVTIEIGAYLIDLGQMVFNSAGFVFTAFTVVSCLVELGQSVFMMVQNLNQLSIENVFSVRKVLYQEVVGHVFDIIFSSGMLWIALLGFWGVINPLVGAGLIASFFMGHLIIKKFFPNLTGVISDWLFGENYQRHIEEPVEVLEVPGIILPDLPGLGRVEAPDSQLGISGHPFGLYGSQRARGLLNTNENESVDEEISSKEEVDLPSFHLSRSPNSFDVT